jgi:hypothetical protein
MKRRRKIWRKGRIWSKRNRRRRERGSIKEGKGEE